MERYAISFNFGWTSEAAHEPGEYKSGSIAFDLIVVDHMYYFIVCSADYTSHWRNGSALDFYPEVSLDIEKNLKVVGSSPTWDGLSFCLFFCHPETPNNA